MSLGDTITPYIELKSKDLITENYMKNVLMNLSDTRDAFKKYQAFLNSSKIFNVRNFVENDDFIIFRCQKGISTMNVIYNKKTEEVKLVDYFENDLIYKKAPPHDWFGLFKFSDSKGAYTTCEQAMFAKLKQSINSNEFVPDFDKLDQLKNLDEESNPVIFFYEFK